MGLDDKAKAAAKNIEGKTQEAVGKMTDNKENQAKGKAKQVEAEARKAGENAKDGVKDAID
ncbi:MAG: CsbD family protein [Sodalinema sp.]|uniref:CsbD family protein n=1 Tax=Sodalinema sp. TaxID=3080550 RepID=UPI0012262A20|nr:MAG: CsbD family protein [Phormidium sp. SL48-SHIP]